MNLSNAIRRLAAPALLLGTLAATARATWTIVALDARTGEIVISSATCIANFNLEAAVPVVVVGKGAAAAQSFIDTSGQNRILIRNGFQTGMTPQDILDALAIADPAHQTRQYGIVDFTNMPVTFTGTGAGIAKFGVVGATGDIRYAIQGNVLTDNAVVTAAEAAFLAAPGDLTQRVMAGMEAARALGGDGRCSCTGGGGPTGCGAPPPAPFKSAHIGFLIASRYGDTDGGCGSAGCASGKYWLNLNVIGSTTSVDPILQLQSQYAAWRAGMAGRPDALYSSVAPRAQRLPADGRTRLQIDIRLADIEQQPITKGGAQVVLLRTSPLSGATFFNGVTDHGDGTYTARLLAGTVTAVDTWHVVVNDGGGPIVLGPPFDVSVEAPTELFAGSAEVEAGRGGHVPLTVFLGTAEAKRRYLILGSASGTQPGTAFRGATLPLNTDGFLRRAFLGPNAAPFHATLGHLDDAGRAHADFAPAPGWLAPWLGSRLSFSAVRLGGTPRVTAPVFVDILP